MKERLREKKKSQKSFKMATTAVISSHYKILSSTVDDKNIIVNFLAAFVQFTLI